MRRALVLTVAGLLAVASCATGEPLEVSPPPEVSVPPAGLDWAGLGRDTAYVLGYELAAAVPLSLSKDGHQLDAWWDNVRNPHWDGDAWWINYVGHPYFGAAYYIRARERGAGGVEAFAYSALMSTLFEYGAEALFEPPSYQDLIVTPVAGTLIGALVFEPLRTRIKAKPTRAWYDNGRARGHGPAGRGEQRRRMAVRRQAQSRAPTPPAPAARAGAEVRRAVASVIRFRIRGDDPLLTTQKRT